MKALVHVQTECERSGRLPAVCSRFYQTFFGHFDRKAPPEPTHRLPRTFKQPGNKPGNSFDLQVLCFLAFFVSKRSLCWKASLMDTLVSLQHYVKTQLDMMFKRPCPVVPLRLMTAISQQEPPEKPGRDASPSPAAEAFSLSLCAGTRSASPPHFYWVIRRKPLPFTVAWQPYQRFRFAWFPAVVCEYKQSPNGGGGVGRGALDGRGAAGRQSIQVITATRETAS